jgi:hypothetical protein
MPKMSQINKYSDCTYKRHIAIKPEVNIHEVGDKAIEKYM